MAIGSKVNTDRGVRCGQTLSRYCMIVSWVMWNSKRWDVHYMHAAMDESHRALTMHAHMAEYCPTHRNTVEVPKRISLVVHLPEPS